MATTHTYSHIKQVEVKSYQHNIKIVLVVARVNRKFNYSLWYLFFLVKYVGIHGEFTDTAFTSPDKRVIEIKSIMNKW